MPYPIQSYKPRRYKTTKYQKKSRRKKKIPRSPKIGYLRVLQKYSLQTTIPTLLPEKGLAFAFSLNQIGNSGVFIDLFDSYRIKSATVKAFPLTNVSNSINPVYKLLVARDYDDDSQPTVANMINRSDVKTHVISSEGNTRQQFSWTVKPRFQTMVYESATQTGYGLGNKSMWLNTQDAKVPHFGLKMVFDTSPTLNSAVIWQFYITYDLEFKSLKSSD